jgi:putative ABC transport system permease protein
MNFSYWGLFFSLLLFAVPLALFFRLGGGLLRSSAVAVCRMAVQLLLVGVYMEWLFAWHNTIVNLIWLALMAAVASLSILHNARLRPKVLLIPVVIGLFVAVLVVGFYLLVAVLRPTHILDTCFLVPVFGLLLGGVQSVGKAILETFYSSLQSDADSYYYLLGNGASHREALRPFFKDALQKAYAPLVANVAVAGLATMPNMMMGAMLGGTAPHVAVVWQIGVVAGVFAASLLFAVVVLRLSDGRAFDGYGRLRSVFRKD